MNNIDNHISNLIDCARLGGFTYTYRIHNRKVVEKFYEISWNDKIVFIIEDYNSHRCTRGLLTSLNDTDVNVLEKLKHNGWNRFGRTKLRLKYDTSSHDYYEIIEQMKLFKYN